jgi:hypothetical protein
MRRKQKSAEKWLPSLHASGRWRVIVPARWSGTGKQKDRYFDTKSEAEKFISDTLKERKEHGKQAVTADERHWRHVAKTELGSVDQLRTVLDHWNKTGRGVQVITAHDAAETFITHRDRDKLNPKTRDDIRWRLRAFGSAFNSTPLHQIAPGRIEQYLSEYPAGWSRKSHHKRLLPFFAYAHRQRWLLESPMDELEPPDTPKSPRTIYTPDQLKKLINTVEFFDREIC